MKAWLAAGLALASAAAMAQEAKLNLGYEPVWLGANGREQLDALPVRVTLENKGESATGTVKVRMEAYSMDVPVELPSGSSKSFIVYPSPPSGWYGSDPEIELATNKGGSKITAPLSLGMNGVPNVGVITDASGRFAFLRGRTSGQGDRARDWQDCYSAPGKAPDRAIGYSLLTALILSEGSERLGDREVAAIRRWVMLGGRLIFFGGSQTPLLRDPRWQDILPVTGGEAKAMRLPNGLFLRAANRPIPQGRNQFTNPAVSPLTLPVSVAVVQGKPTARVRSENGLVLEASQSFGLGEVVFMAVNPAEQPLRTWAGSKHMTLAMLDEGRNRRMLSMNPSQDGFALAPPMGIPGGPRMTVPPMSPQNPEPESSPFEVKLPSGWMIFGILIAYWIVVVPIHLLLLRRFNLSQLAWFTAPIIALGFAGIFFTLAQGLYTAKLSTVLDGVIVTHSGQNSAAFVGRQQFFFPAPGSHDLKFSGVEAVRAANADMNFRRFGRRTAPGMPFEGSLFDIGEIVAPQVGVGSLSFREIRMLQGIELMGPLEAKLEIRGNRLVGTITNRTGFEIADAIITDSVGWETSIGTIPAGGKNSIDVQLPRGGYSEKLLLEGGMNAAPGGSPIGERILPSTRVRLRCGLTLVTRGVSL